MSAFSDSLWPAGDIDIDEVASLYASDFIAASPAGVSGDEQALLRNLKSAHYPKPEFKLRPYQS
jgi:hypothetical protein